MAASVLKPANALLGAVSVASRALKKNAAVVVTSCRYESGLPPLKTEKISDNLQLKSIQDDSQSSRPLILLFGWMLAKQKHLNKYGNMYHSKGFDVLSLKMRPGQVLIPQRAQDTVEHLLSVLEDSSLAQKPLMVHGFSVGGYMYGEMLVKLRQQRARWQGICDRMTGQIFDSPVDYEGIAPGFSRVLVKNRLGQKLLLNTLEGYLKLFQKPITRHYLASSQAFHDNNLRLPSLMLYSRADPIGVDTRIELVIKKWKAAGIPVMSRCWESSPHVSHFHRHPDEYVEAVLGFLDSIRLSQPEQKDSKIPEEGKTKAKEEIQQRI
ncbi:transmembrane protein 53-B [Aplysia californica]|uniref:Transmembrane protein 53-B n=1 Tax=Aplysia californica TaxID=6500 RepID=A0ABM0K8N7_APLCA|nr:transmembrane protein 53-B [Aplysia californica]